MSQSTQNKSSKKTATTTGTQAAQQPATAKKKSTIPNPQYKRNFKNDGDDDDDDDNEERTKSNSNSSSENTSDADNEKVNECVEAASSSSKKKYKKLSPATLDEVEYAKLLAELFPSNYSKQKATTLEKEKEKGQKNMIMVLQRHQPR